MGKTVSGRGTEFCWCNSCNGNAAQKRVIVVHIKRYGMSNNAPGNFKVAYERFIQSFGDDYQSEDEDYVPPKRHKRRRKTTSKDRHISSSSSVSMGDMPVEVPSDSNVCERSSSDAYDEADDELETGHSLPDDLQNITMYSTMYSTELESAKSRKSVPLTDTQYVFHINAACNAYTD
jgi:hypothetical protein